MAPPLPASPIRNPEVAPGLRAFSSQPHASDSPHVVSPPINIQHLPESAQVRQFGIIGTQASVAHRLEDSWSLSPTSDNDSDTQEFIDALDLQMHRDSTGLDYPPETCPGAAFPVPNTPVGSGHDEVESQAQANPGFSYIQEELGGELTILEAGPRLAGGFATVQKGIWTSSEGKQIEVAVKTLRIDPSSITQDVDDLKKRVEIVSLFRSRFS